MWNMLIRHGRFTEATKENEPEIQLLEIMFTPLHQNDDGDIIDQRNKSKTLKSKNPMKKQKRRQSSLKLHSELVWRQKCSCRICLH